MGSPKLQLQTRKIKESGKLSHSARWCSQAGLAEKQPMPREAFRFTLKPSPSQFLCLPPDKSLSCRSPSGRRAWRLGLLRSPRRPTFSPVLRHPRDNLARPFFCSGGSLRQILELLNQSFVLLQGPTHKLCARFFLGKSSLDFPEFSKE